MQDAETMQEVAGDVLLLSTGSCERKTALFVCQIIYCYPDPKWLRPFGTNPFAQRSSVPCAQMLSDLCNRLEHLPKKQKHKKPLPNLPSQLIYLVLRYPINNNKCHSSDTSWCQSTLCTNNSPQHDGPKHIRHMLFASNRLLSGEIQQCLHQKVGWQL